MVHDSKREVDMAGWVIDALAHRAQQQRVSGAESSPGSKEEPSPQELASDTKAALPNGTSVVGLETMLPRMSLSDSAVPTLSTTSS